MKHVIWILMLAAGSAMAQTNIPDYQASNGITYRAGDTLKLGRGSAPNGDFRYVQAKGLMMDTKNDDNNNLSRSYSGGNAIVKRVANWKKKGADRIYLVVGVGLASNYWIAIEDAIATCEIAECKD